MTYTYKEYEEDIRLGREIEFTYKGEKYSITNTPEGWHFMKFHDYNTLQVYVDEEELLEKAHINSKRIAEIWQDIVVETVY